MQETEMSLEELNNLFKKIIWEENYGKKKEVEKLWLKVPAYRNYLALKKIYTQMKKDYKPETPKFQEIETFDFKTYRVGDTYELFDPKTQAGKFHNGEIIEIEQIDQQMFKITVEGGSAFRVKGVEKTKPI